MAVISARKKLRLKRQAEKAAAAVSQPAQGSDVIVKNVVGICNHNPYQVSQLLDGYKLATMTMAGEVVGPKRADYLLVPLVATLLQYRATVLAFKGTVLVFDDPVKLDHVLHAGNILDLISKSHSYQYAFGPLTLAKLEGANVERRPLVLDQERIDVLPQMINAVQGSIAQVIMESTQSLIPTLKSDVLKMIFTWISIADVHPAPVDEMEKLGIEDPDTMLAPLHTFLETEQGKKTTKAFKLLLEYRDKGKSVPYAKIEKATGVPSFDLQFAIRYIRRSTAVRRPGMTLTQIHAARKLKADNDILAGLDVEDET